MRPGAINNVERTRFQSGQKLAAVISSAASIGISLHAEASVANQRKRIHMNVQPSWSADTAIQQCGRTHRSNQVTAPHYLLVMSDIGE